MPKKKTTLEFVEDAKNIHGDLYDYTKSIYIDSKTKLTVGCKKHGNFEQSPTNHLNGQGCPKCGREKCDENRKVWTKESFKEKVSELHPDLIFDKTAYVNPKIQVTYECKIHGEKITYPYNLLKGCGCKNCSSQKSNLSKEEWLSRFENCDCENISYEKIPREFKAEEKIIFICSIHGKFEQTPIDHLKSCCTECGRAKIYEYHRDNPVGWSYTNWQKAAERSKHFDSFKVYILKCWNDEEEFYKIGKTFKTVEKRFEHKVMPYKYEVMDIFIFNDAKKASRFEKYLQKNNKNNRYLPKNKFNGSFECFLAVQQTKSRNI